MNIHDAEMLYKPDWRRLELWIAQISPAVTTSSEQRPGPQVSAACPLATRASQSLPLPQAAESAVDPRAPNTTEIQRVRTDCIFTYRTEANLHSAQPEIVMSLKRKLLARELEENPNLSS